MSCISEKKLYFYEILLIRGKAQLWERPIWNCPRNQCLKPKCGNQRVKNCIYYVPISAVKHDWEAAKLHREDVESPWLCCRVFVCANAGKMTQYSFRLAWKLSRISLQDWQFELNIKYLLSHRWEICLIITIIIMHLILWDQTNGSTQKHTQNLGKMTVIKTFLKDKSWVTKWLLCGLIEVNNECWENRQTQKSHPQNQGRTL